MNPISQNTKHNLTKEYQRTGKQDVLDRKPNADNRLQIAKQENSVTSFLEQQEIQGLGGTSISHGGHSNVKDVTLGISPYLPRKRKAGKKVARQKVEG